MIKSFEELGEVLADFETRLLTVENSLPCSREKPEPLDEVEPVKVEYIYHHINPQTGIVSYLQSKVKEFLSLKEKLESHINASKKTKRYKTYNQ